MNARRKRRISAFVLLAVYLSMLLFASLHIHPKAFTDTTVCADCVHHQVHHGHITTAAGPLHVCLLCQFLSITYVAVAVATVVFFVKVLKFYDAAPYVHTEQIKRGIVGLRAPPFLYS